MEKNETSRPRRSISCRRACQNCRKRHSKCNGESPCYQCLARWEHCIYDEDPIPSPTMYSPRPDIIPSHHLPICVEAMNLYERQRKRKEDPNIEPLLTQFWDRLPSYNHNVTSPMIFNDFVYVSRIAIGLFEMKNIELSRKFGNLGFSLLSKILQSLDLFLREQRILLVQTVHESTFYWIQLLEKFKSCTLCWYGKCILETIAVPDEGFRVPVFIEVQQLAFSIYASSGENEKLHYLLQVIDLLPHIPHPDPLMLCRTAFLIIGSTPSSPISSYKGVYLHQILRFMHLISASIDSCTSPEVKALYIMIRLMLYAGNPNDATFPYDISHVFALLENPNMESFGFWVTGYALCFSLAIGRREFAQSNHLAHWWEYYNLWFPFLKYDPREIITTGGYPEEKYFT